MPEGEGHQRVSYRQTIWAYTEDTDWRVWVSEDGDYEACLRQVNLISSEEFFK